MVWWIYKCNSRKKKHQVSWGDWEDFFTEGADDDHWGCAEWTRDLLKAKIGDMVIAYQTDRNELVGVAEVRQTCEEDGYIYLTALERIGAKVRPLKEADPKIATIPALQPGPIKTLYEISQTDAARLLKMARAAVQRKQLV